MRTIALVTFLFCCIPAVAQVSISRQVLGTAAINSTTLSSHTGEVAVEQWEAGAIRLTEGFEQPATTPLTVDVEVNYEACWNGENATVTLINAAGCGEIESVLWNGEEGGLFVENVTNGVLTIVVNSTGGCSFQTEIEVATPNLPPCDLNIYDVITPNGDGKNDGWVIGNIRHPDYQTNEVVIVNRWGAKVWEGKDYDNDTVIWDGRATNGEALPEGAYYYEIKLASTSFVGSLNLLQ
jgi:gliding motility-associated-like protein